MIVYEEDNDLCSEVAHHYFVIGDDLEYKGYKRAGTYPRINIDAAYAENISWLIKELKRIV